MLWALLGLLSLCSSLNRQCRFENQYSISQHEFAANQIVAQTAAAIWRLQMKAGMGGGGNTRGKKAWISCFPDFVSVMLCGLAGPAIQVTKQSPSDPLRAGLI